jgi:Putative zinc-finger
MIARLERLSMRWPGRHPGAKTLSRYHEGELGGSERAALERHLAVCSDCKTLLESLRSTVEALATLHSRASPGLADSVIAALRAQDSSPELASGHAARHGGSPTLTLLAGAREGQGAIATEVMRAPRGLRAAAQAIVGFCLRRPQLRVTVPLALLVGVALSLINQGSMIFGGRASLLDVCLQCSPNFVIPFLALNVGLLLAARVAARRRP